MVVDPQLLDELDRMTSAYRVVAPGEPQPSMDQILQAEGSSAATAQPASQTAGTVPGQADGTGADGSAAPNTAAVDPTTAASGATALPDASTQPTPGADAGVTSAVDPGAVDPGAVDPGTVQIPGTVAGTGQGAAASFLERLRTVAARYPVLVLPYGDPDVVALVRAGLLGEVTTAVQHGTGGGRSSARHSIGRLEPDRPGRCSAIATAPITSMAFPINGATDAATLRALRAAGLSTALLSEESRANSTVRPVGAALVTRARHRRRARRSRPRSRNRTC